MLHKRIKHSYKVTKYRLTRQYPYSLATVTIPDILSVILSFFKKKIDVYSYILFEIYTQKLMYQPITTTKLSPTITTLFMVVHEYWAYWRIIDPTIWDQLQALPDARHMNQNKEEEMKKEILYFSQIDTLILNLNNLTQQHTLLRNWKPNEHFSRRTWASWATQPIGGSLQKLPKGKIYEYTCAHPFFFFLKKKPAVSWSVVTSYR